MRTYRDEVEEEVTWTSMHFKLRIVEPLFWAVSKFLDAPVAI